MPKYYVAGIPFDSENALMHYGVKGMKWDKHIFGPDANTKYINWMDVGKMASSKRPSNFTDTGSGGDKPILSTRSGAKQSTTPSKFQSAVRSVGGALNSGSNFLTGNQARNNLNNAQNAASKAKSELVKNARLYNAGKSNLENANQLATSAANKVLEHNPADPNYQVPEEAANEYRKSKQLERAGKLKVGQANTNRDEAMKNWLNAQSNLNTAQKETENTLPSVAGKAASGAKGFINSAGKWVSNAANDAGRWIGNAANDVGKAATNAWNGVTGAANDVANFVTGNQARQNLENAMSAPHLGDLYRTKDAEKIFDAQDEYNRTLPGMVDQAGNWISGAVNDVGKAATNVWNGIPGAANDIANFVTGNQSRQNLERWQNSFNPFGLNNGRIAEAQAEYDRTLPGLISGAANDVGKWVGGVVENPAKWISGAANDVGNWAGQAVNDVSNFVTGNQARRDLNNVQNSWNPFGVNNGRIAEAQAEYNRTLPGMVDQAGNWISGAANDAGKWLGGAANDVGKAATNAWNGVTGAAGDAGKWISGAANDVGKAASNAGSWAGQAANDAGKWIGGAVNDVGNAAKNAWNGATGWLGGAAKDVGKAASDAAGWVGDRAGDVGRAVSGAADDAGKWIGNAAGDAGRWISGAVNDVGKAASDAAGWVGDRAGDVGRTAANVWNGATDVANDVGNFVIGNQARQNLEREQNAFNPFGLNNKNIANAQAEYNRTLPGMVDQAGNWISGAVNDVGRFVGNAAGDVGKAATNAWNGVTGAANSVGDWAGNAARDVGNAAGSTMKALENAYGDASKWVVDNAGTVRDAVTGAALGTADWAVQQYKNLFHSAIDDKPDGVTDTFWKNYVASGGTREQYERDWR